MAYLSVKNFWHYQNADIWKKAKGHPPWFKYFVHRDREIDHLPYVARLLWTELLACASRNSNVLEDDLNWLSAETRIDAEAIAEALPLLVKGGWLSQTRTPRRSRQLSRTPALDVSLPLAEAEAEKKVLVKADTWSRGAGPALFKIPPSVDVEQEVDKMLHHFHGVEPNSRAILLAAASGLPLGAVAKVRESVEARAGSVGVGYAVNALRDERKETA